MVWKTRFAAAGLWLGTFLLGGCSKAAPAKPTLRAGVIHFVESGQERVIPLDKPCADLWVSPDERVIAFITVQEAAFGTENAADPAIDESSVYIARKAEHYKPLRLPFPQVVIGGSVWRVFRSPSVSPDQKTVYFSVPVTMKDWKLMRFPLAAGPPRELFDQSEYCVIWGGAYSGSLLTLENVYEPQSEGLQCFVRNGSGGRNRMDDRDCTAFLTFAAKWARQHHGECAAPGFGTDSE